MSDFGAVVLEEHVVYQGLPSSLDLTLLFSSPSQQPQSYEDFVEQDMSMIDEEFPESPVYFMLPSSSLGNRITSYGGYLRYSLFYEVNSPDGK